jgi:cell division protease FtsH
MVTRWGMSREDRAGATRAARESLPGQLGRIHGRKVFQRGDATAEAIDAEVRRIIGESHDEARRLLSVHRKQLDLLASALLSRETLNEQEILEVTGLPPAPALENGVLPAPGAPAPKAAMKRGSS